MNTRPHRERPQHPEPNWAMVLVVAGILSFLGARALLTLRPTAQRSTRPARRRKSGVAPLPDRGIDIPLSAHLSRNRWRVVIGSLLAAMCLVAGVHQWWSHNQFAQVAQAQPAVALTVTDTDPVQVTPPGAPSTRVHGAPAGLHPGDVVSVYVDDTHTGAVFYARETTGLRQALWGAAWLLGYGTAAWALVVAIWTRCARRRTVAALAVGSTRTETITAVDPTVRRSHAHLLHRLTHPPTTRVWVSSDPAGPGYLVTGGPLFPGELVHVHSSRRLGGPAITTGDRAWWPAPSVTAQA